MNKCVGHPPQCDKLAPQPSHSTTAGSSGPFSGTCLGPDNLSFGE